MREDDFQEQTTEFHTQRNSGLGVMPDKTELGGTEIISPTVRKRVFSVWHKRQPLGFGFQITRHNLKLYLIWWLVGIGWIPEEVVWERQERERLQQEKSSEKGQIAIT